jgi:Trk-type K+ transport system membrane component
MHDYLLQEKRDGILLNSANMEWRIMKYILAILICVVLSLAISLPISAGDKGLPQVSESNLGSSVSIQASFTVVEK